MIHVLHGLRPGGSVIRVEPQVFDVMTRLISNHHRFVSKEELFDTVWGGRFVGESQRNIRTARGVATSSSVPSPRATGHRWCAPRTG